MYRFSNGQKIAFLATVLGAILVLTAGYLALPDDSSERATGEAPSVTVPPSDPGPDEIPDNIEDALDPGSGLQPGFGTNGVDPFDNMSGSRQMYNVKITLRSDGQMKYIYRFRSGYSAVQAANGSAGTSRQLRGPRAVAQTFVQLVGGTFATCTISIDGKVVSSSTAKKMYDVVACTG